VDQGEKIVALVDLERRTVTRIGREGSGPGEFSSPNKVLAALGDTTIVGDLAGRLSKLAPTGVYVGDVAIPGLAGRNAEARTMGALMKLVLHERAAHRRSADRVSTCARDERREEGVSGQLSGFAQHVDRDRHRSRWRQ
jgi:hypothetical protein